MVNLFPTTIAHSRRGYRVFCDEEGWKVALYHPARPREDAQVLSVHPESWFAFEEVRERVAKWEQALLLYKERIGTL